MKKALLFSFFTLGTLTLAFVIFQKGTADVNEEFNHYKLTTSGAGEAMDAWAYERGYPDGKVPSDRFLQVFHNEKKRKTASTRDGEDCWESIGPENIGGRILCLAFHPTDPNTIYAGSASGGLWKTTTMGQGRNAWEHIPVGFPVLGIGAIVIDPNNPDVMYLGTGEVYTNLGLSEPGTINRLTRGSYGIGILKTEDGGVTWNQSLSFPQSELIGVSDMEMSTQNSNEVYAATTLGTYQTKDGGANWDLIHPVGPAIDIELDPTNDNVIYISQGNMNLGLNPNLCGLFKSTNKGESFTELLDDGLLDVWSGSGKLSLVPGSPNTIYASLQVGWFNNGATTPGGLYRSTDGGSNWTPINNTNVAFWQGWYSHDIAIHPSKSDELIHIGINAWKSVNGGNTLTQVSDASTWQFGKISVDEPEGDDTYIHADIHAVYYHPLDSDKIFFAGDGGVYMSPDGGATFVTLNGGLQTTQFYPNFATSPKDENFAIGGTQDNASYIYDGSPSWTRVLGGDGMSAAINFDNDNVVYASAQGLYLTRSFDRGNTFTFISPPTATNEITAFSAPYELSPADPDIIYAGRQFLYRSFDKGTTWFATSVSPLDGDNMIVNIALSATNTAKVYAATAPNPFSGISSAKLLKSDDAGVTWQNISSALPNRIIKDIAVDPEDDETLFVAFSGFGSAHLAYSEDGGTSWELINSLPDVPTNSVFIDPLRTDHIYVGNDLGVYFSKDRGETWEVFSHGLPEATLSMHLSYSKANRRIRVATHGRGVYERDLVYNEFTGTQDIELANTDAKAYPNPANQVVNLEFDAGVISSGRLSVISIKGERVVSKTVSLSKGKNSIPIDVNDLQNGQYVIQLEGKAISISTPFIKVD